MSEHAHLYRRNRWKVKSEKHRKRNPLCVYCLREGKVTVGQVADHIRPHKGDEFAFWNNELQTLCKNCHDSVKKREEFGAQSFNADGSPVGGWS